MKGFFLALAGTVLGATVSFVVLRLLFSKRLRKWSATNEQWTALETVVVSTCFGLVRVGVFMYVHQKTKGLPLIILIRMSPMPPWVYANTLFAVSSRFSVLVSLRQLIGPPQSIHTVALWQFVVATFFLSPKLLLYTFVGSHLAPLSDGRQREGMDTQAKIINGCLVGGGVIIGLVASVVVYRLVQRQIRHLKGVSPSTEEDIIEALEEADEGAPLLMNLSSESLLEEGSRQPLVIRDREEDD